MRDIKFNFVYGIDGEESTYVTKTFTFGEIENGCHWDEISDSPLLRDYTIIAKRQYTGLTDKNGVEIYEGDILSGEWGEQESEHAKDPLIAPVVFSNGCFVIDWCIKKHTLERADMGVMWREDYPRFTRYYETTPLEIIGNIWENKELLEEK